MFNENEIFCYSIDVATEIYKNISTQEEANKRFFKELELFLQNTGQKFVHSQGQKIFGLKIDYKCFLQTISVFIFNDNKKSVSEIILNGKYTKSLVEDGFSNKCLFGLPINSIWFDGLEEALIKFRTFDTYLENDSPHGRFRNLIELAGKGNSDCQFELAMNYYNGTNIELDYTKAAFWFEKAAQQGHETAQYNIAHCYENGLGVVQDYKSAFLWYQKAALQGDIDAMSNIGLFYYIGRGCDQDYKEAVKWWDKAASLGHDKAIYNLGISYRDGTGIQQDLLKAKTLFLKAKELGHYKASQALNDLKRIYGI